MAARNILHEKQSLAVIQMNSMTFLGKELKIHLFVYSGYAIQVIPVD
jgi:hypothetical protein